MARTPLKKWRLTNRNGAVIGSYWTYEGLMDWIRGGNPRKGVRYRIEHWENNQWRYLSEYYWE